jgi:hypothetical protein
MKILCSIALLILLSIQGLAQKKPMAFGTVKQTNYIDTIPFEYIHNYIIIKAKINGNEGRFMIDFGATNVISSDFNKKHKLKVLGEVNSVDVSGIEKKTDVVLFENIQLGTINFVNNIGGVKDINAVEFISCLKIDGLLGSNMFQNCIIQIDLSKKLIIISDKMEMLNLNENSVRNKLEIDNQGRPYFTNIKVGDLILNLMYDSGSNSFFSIKDTISDNLAKDSNVLVLNESIGDGNIGINGIGNKTRKKRLLLNNVQICGKEIRNVIYTNSKTSKNVFGNQILEYGILTLNFIDKSYEFNTELNSQDYKKKKTLGFSITPKEKNYIIGTVWSNTEADKSGLKYGDEIIKINNFDFSKRKLENDCNYLSNDFMNKSEIELIYKNENNEAKSIKLFKE